MGFSGLYARVGAPQSAQVSGAQDLQKWNLPPVGLVHVL